MIGGAADQPHVFVSFASADRELADRAVARLEEAGLGCWIAHRDIEPAASYPAAITSAVERSGAVLLLLTADAVRSPHVLREVELAFTKRRPILPVRLGGTTPAADLQYFLSTTQWLDAGATLDDDELDKVRVRLHDILRGAPLGGRGAHDDQQRRRRLGAAAMLLVAAGVVTVWMWRTDRDGATPPLPDSVPTDRPIDVPPQPVPDSSPRTIVNPRDGAAYVWIPPGQFVMGCSPSDSACAADEHPTRVVEIPRGFWLARTEVTGAQYSRWRDGAAAHAPRDGERPVTGVSWANAREYCAAAGGRLPTEAEWEYAARGATTLAHYGAVAAVAWFEANSEGGPHPVGMRRPNAFGLHDMLGNVSEWVLDRYYDRYDEADDPLAPDLPLAPNASAVARGGSFLSDAPGVRASRRLELEPDAAEPHVGFRCAADRL